MYMTKSARRGVAEEGSWGYFTRFNTCKLFLCIQFIITIIINKMTTHHIPWAWLCILREHASCPHFLAPWRAQVAWSWQRLPPVHKLGTDFRKFGRLQYSNCDIRNLDDISKCNVSSRISYNSGISCKMHSATRWKAQVTAVLVTP